jgi:hypothetical protein
MKGFLIAAVIGGMAIGAASAASAAGAGMAGTLGEQLRASTVSSSALQDVRARRVCKWRWGKRRCWWVRDHRRDRHRRHYH